ncbi:hypothetical protein GCM10009765_17770 [Fodinicola feengrottensis]|uniref:Anti-sigma-D factor RsdA sigma factor binding region domain-containing protein n=1 Tax=Fodinicola feengrottensis TaxID=435914 RepID=A0ABN2GC16_9ACTN
MSFRDPRESGKRKAAVDIGALNRDESLVSALGRGDRPHGVNGDPVVDLLFRWRADLDVAGNTIEISAPREPVGAGPVREPANNPTRFFGRAGRKILVAAAVAVFGIGSVGGVAAATGAGPDSTFWPIALALNTERARSVQSSHEVTAMLNKAEAAIHAGQLSVAADQLAKAQTALADVQPTDGAVALKARLEDLQNQLARLRGEPPASGRPTAPGSPGTGAAKQSAPNTPGAHPRPSATAHPGAPAPTGSAAGSPSSPITPTISPTKPGNDGSDKAQPPYQR